MNSCLYPYDITRGHGRIEVILGPMFSGKTTELIRRIRRFQFANFKCVIYKYANDLRYSENDVATHDLQKLRAVPCHSLMDVWTESSEYEVIGIDEGQFFPDLVQFCEYLANRGKIVVVAALDGTYRRTPFGDILRLVPLAESVIKLSAICMNCFQNASFTKRITSDTNVEVIGGADKYMAVCRECYDQGDAEEDLIPLKSNDVNECVIKGLNNIKCSN